MKVTLFRNYYKVKFWLKLDVHSCVMMLLWSHHVDGYKLTTEHAGYPRICKVYSYMHRAI